MIFLRIVYGHLQCLIYTLVAIAKRGPSPKQTDESKKIIVNSIRIYNLYNWSIELAYYHIMRSKGYDVKILVDDGVLFSHQYKNRLHEKYPYRVWITSYFLKLYKIFAPSIYRDILLVRDLVESSIHFDFDEKHVLSSLTRFYLSVPDTNILKLEEGYDEVKRRTEEDCRVMSAVNVALVREGFKTLFTSHGFYTSWGPTYEYFRENGRAITYGGDGFRHACINLSDSEPAAEKLVLKERFNKVHSYSLDQIRRINSSRNQERMNWQSVDSDVFQGGEEEVYLNELRSLRQQCNKIVGVIPNVLWDNAVVSDEVNTVFNGPVEWLLELLDFANSNSDLGLVIRVHPSENSIMFARKGVGELLSEIVKETKNVILIPKHSKFKTPLLFEYCDLFTVYNGTFGLECMYNKIPVLFAGRSNFESIVSMAVSSKKEYFDMLSKGLGSDIEKYELVELLYYYYFELNQYELDILDKSHRIKTTWNNFDIADFAQIISSLNFEIR